MLNHRVKLVLLLVAAFTLGGCAEKLNLLKARQAFKEAHQHYANKEYKEAIEKYSLGLELDPDADIRVRIPVHFYRGSSHHLMYKPSATDDPENEAHLDEAMTGYEKTLDVVEAEVPDGSEHAGMLLPYRKYSMEQLAAIHRDNLDDFPGAEKYFRRLVEVSADAPADPTGDPLARFAPYYALADIYERFHDPDEMPLLEKAVEAYKAPVDIAPEEKVTYRQVANLLNKYGRFDETMEWLKKARDVQADNPEGYYLMAVHYWDKVYRDPDLTANDKKDYIGLGIEVLDQALEINSEYVDALIYKNLLLRERAKIEPRNREALTAEANELRDRAIALKQEQDEAAKANAAAASEAKQTESH